MEKNNNFSLIILVFCILSMIIGLLGGYIIFNNISQKDPKASDNNTDQKQEFSLEDAKEVMKNYQFSYGCDGSSYIVSTDKNVQISLAFSHLSGTNTTCKKIYGDNYTSNSDSYISQCGSNSQDTIKQYSYNSVNDEFKKLFGKTLSKERAEGFHYAIYDYLKEIDNFVYLGTFGGGDCPSLVKSDVDSFKVDGDSLTIYVIRHTTVLDGSGQDENVKYEYLFTKSTNDYYLTEIKVVS